VLVATLVSPRYLPSALTVIELGLQDAVADQLGIAALFVGRQPGISRASG
jgi:hypothetical protein